MMSFFFDILTVDIGVSRNNRERRSRQRGDLALDAELLFAAGSLISIFREELL